MDLCGAEMVAVFVTDDAERWRALGVGLDITPVYYTSWAFQSAVVNRIKVVLLDEAMALKAEAFIERKLSYGICCGECPRKGYSWLRSEHAIAVPWSVYCHLTAPLLIPRLGSFIMQHEHFCCWFLLPTAGVEPPRSRNK